MTIFGGGGLFSSRHRFNLKIYTSPFTNSLAF